MTKQWWADKWKSFKEWWVKNWRHIATIGLTWLLNLIKQKKEARAIRKEMERIENNKIATE